MSSAKLKASKKRIAKKNARGKRGANAKPKVTQSRLDSALKSGNFLREAMREARAPGRKAVNLTINDMVAGGDETIRQLIPAHAMLEVYQRGVEDGLIDAVIPEDLIVDLDRGTVQLFEDVAALYTGRDIQLSTDEMSEVYVHMLSSSLTLMSDEYPRFTKLLEGWYPKLDRVLDKMREELVMRDDLPESYNATHEIQKQRMAKVYPLYSTPATEGAV